MANGKVVTLTDISDEVLVEVLVEVCRAANAIACECPGYLTRLLRQVRAFRQYTTTCLEQSPADIETHRWLAGQAEKVEKILLQTLVELLQKEGLIDETQQIALDQISDRTREIVLKQLGKG